MLTVCMCSSLKAADIDVQLVGVSNQNMGRGTAEQCIQARQIATLQHLTGLSPGKDAALPYSGAMLRASLPCRAQVRPQPRSSRWHGGQPVQLRVLRMTCLIQLKEAQAAVSTQPLISADQHCSQSFHPLLAALWRCTCIECRNISY